MAGQARLDVPGDDRGLDLRAVPGLLGRDHVAQAALGDLYAHAGPVAEPSPVGPVPARARGGPRRPRAAELADRRQWDDGDLPDRRRDGGLRARALPLPHAHAAAHAHPDDPDVPARRARDPAVRDHAQGAAARHLLEPDHHLPRVLRADRHLGHARVHRRHPGGARARRADRRRHARRRDVAGRAAARRTRAGDVRGAELPRGLEGVPARADLPQRGLAQDRAARAAVLRRARRRRLGRGHGDLGALHAAGGTRLHPRAQAPHDRSHGRGGERVRLGVEAALVDGRLVPGDVSLVDGTVEAIGLSGPGSGIAAPGFIDLQVNGFAGVDLMETDRYGYARVGEALLATGTTAFLPTFITASEDALVEALRAMPLEGIGARVLGAHVEGPFLSPRRSGVHDRRHLSAPDLALLRRLLDVAPVAQVTLAPELPGAFELIDELVARGIVVSAGHTDATAAEAHLAFDRGVSTVTHLFNAMRPSTARDPSIALAALARTDVIVQVIVDLHHVAPDTVLVAWNAAAGRFALVTDAAPAAGMGDGEFV